MTTHEKSYSRPVAAAGQLGTAAEDSHRFIDKQVLLTGEADILATENGRQCMLAALSLLVRICRNVTVEVPAQLTALKSECRTTAENLEFGNAVSFPKDEIDKSKFDAILCVGKKAKTNLPWTVINSNGWLARVSSGPTNLAEDCGQPNPVASLAAACLGVAEVFKRLIALKPARAEMWDGFMLSLYDYRSGGSGPGPVLPVNLSLDLLVVGAGAIGNGVAYLLRLLPVSGRVLVVDNQSYAEENLGTSILVGPKDIGKWKADFFAEQISGRVSAKGFTEDLAAFSARLGSQIAHPKVAIGCMHDIEGRHQLQNLWLDMTIDGAIGDFAFQVSRHPHDSDIACLMCILPNRGTERAEAIASRETGLNIRRVQQPDALVMEEDVLDAPKEKQEWLRTRIGQPICSVIAAAQQISQERQRAGFQPSVPFVACLSACLVVAELIKCVSMWSSQLAPRFQMDALTGRGDLFPQARRKDCPCVTRKKNIDRVRARRVPSV